MTVSITSSGISLDGPLVAGEKVAVSVSGLALAAEDKPTLALLARFPDALLASVELTESDTPGTWTGELDTATKQTALFFATARADERRDAALELVSGRASLARLTVPMANSALCPKPDGSPFASPVYVPVPGPPGQGCDPYDQAPEMDGEASAGTADEYARGDHRHPTDTTRQAVISDLDAIRSGSAAGATAVQPSALAPVATTGNYADLVNKPTIPPAQVQSDWNQTDAASADFIKNKPTIPGPAPVTSVNGETGDVALYGNTLIMGQGQSTLVSTAITNAQSDATRALNELPFKATAASIAPAFSSSSTYAVGDYVTHEGLLYKCTTAVTTAGAWNAANWSAVSAMAETPAPITVDSAMSSSSTNPVQNKVVKAAIDGRVPWANAAKNALTIGTRTGTIGDSSLSQGETCTASGDYSHAEGYGTTASGYQTHAEGRETTASYTSAHAEGNGTTASGNAAHAEGYQTTAAGNISHSEGLSTYAGGRPSHAEGEETTAAGIASHADGYRAVTAASGSGSSAATPHDYAFAWQGVSTGGYYRSHGAGTFNINPVGGAAGFYIGEDSLASLFRYAFASPTPTVSGTAATVACMDRAINDFTVATGITSLTITPPAAVTGRARDFFCRVTLTDSSLPTVTLTGATIDIGASEVEGMTQGVNLLMFTEIASGHWLASRRSAS